MATRPKDRRYVRFIGPADCQYGEHRGEAVEILDITGPSWLVRFPDGATATVHENHLTDAVFSAP